jgi:hypothetical protein
LQSGQAAIADRLFSDCAVITKRLRSDSEAICKDFSSLSPPFSSSLSRLFRLVLLVSRLSSFFTIISSLFPLPLFASFLLYLKLLSDFLFQVGLQLSDLKLRKIVHDHKKAKEHETKKKIPDRGNGNGNGNIKSSSGTSNSNGSSRNGNSARKATQLGASQFISTGRPRSAPANQQHFDEISPESFEDKVILSSTGPLVFMKGKSTSKYLSASDCCKDRLSSIDL